jgi:hypothetical protein
MNPLGMLEMAGCVVGDIEVERRSSARSSIGEELGYISHRGGESRGPFAPQEMPVILEQGTTSRAVDHQEICLVTQSFQVLNGQFARRRSVAGMLMKRAATPLISHVDDSIAVGLQSTSRSLMYVAEQRVHDAPAEERDSRPGSGKAGSLPSVCVSRFPHPFMPFPDLGARGEHSQSEPELIPARQKSGQASRSESPGGGKKRAPQPRLPENAEHKTRE